MQLKSIAGTVKLTVWHGYDPGSRRWGCPIRQQWSLSAHQQLSPALEDKLCFTLTATGSFAQAAALAQKWHASRRFDPARVWLNGWGLGPKRRPGRD
jgi:hypothetical protein